jgi:hypothetical protein
MAFDVSIRLQVVSLRWKGVEKLLLFVFTTPGLHLMEIKVEMKKRTRIIRLKSHEGVAYFANR